MATQVKIVNGLRGTGRTLESGKITIRYSRDSSGETLSLAAGDTMLVVNASAVRKMMQIK